MKPKSLMLLGISGTFGLIAAALLTTAVGKNKSTGPKKDFGEVVIASKDLEINTLLTKENCKVEKWPISIIPPHAVRSFDEIENKRTTTRVNQKAPISKRDLQDRHLASHLPVPKGLVMYGITAPAEDHHNGMLQPGHLVNVIGIYKVTGEQGMTAKTVVRRARVLAINAKTSVDGAGSDSDNRGKITVSIGVKQNQATLLGLIAKSGTLKLSILGDASEAEKKSGPETAFSFNDGGIVSSKGPKRKPSSGSLLSSLFAGGQKSQTPSPNSPQTSYVDSKPQVINVIAGQNVLQYELVQGEMPRLISGNPDEFDESENGSEYNDYGDRGDQDGSSNINSIPPDARNLD